MRAESSLLELCRVQPILYKVNLLKRDKETFGDKKKKPNNS